MAIECRTSPRYAFIAEAEVTVIATNTTLKARTTDISIDGCFLDMLNPSPKGTDIRVKISRDGSTFEALGVWESSYLLWQTWEWALPSRALTVIRKRFYKSGFQKQGTSQQALKSDLTHLEHLANGEIKTKSGVLRTQVAIVLFAKGPSHGPCRKIAPALSENRNL